MTDCLFQIDNLSVEVPGRYLLNDITLTLPAGQMIALIGHNGSGKSTLLKVLARQIAGRGKVCFEGRALKDRSARDYARRLAFLPQHPPAAEGMTTRELVALGRYPWHGAMGRFSAKDHAAVDQAMEECGMSHFADQLVDTMSGGERQKAWLAMMVAQQASTLLLDEPISALDIAHQVEVLSLVQSMCRTQKRSAVIVLHDVNMAARYCNHIIALKSGKLAMQADPDGLMREEALQAIYGLPMQILTQPDGQKVTVPA